MAKYKIAETFISLNGEGTRSGQLAYFVRFSGCSLNCSFCDTDWAKNDSQEFSVQSEYEIYEDIRLSGVTNVTVTGGEPLEQPNIIDFLKLLVSDELLHIEIETNGSVDLSPFLKLRNTGRLSFTMDYKLPGSGMEIMMRFSNFNLLNKFDTVKMVVGSLEDLNRGKTVIEAYDLTEKCQVLLSPVFGAITPQEIAEFIKENKLNRVGLQIQLHKLLWGEETKGV